jgi:hypothetical protein
VRVTASGDYWLALFTADGALAGGKTLPLAAGAEHVVELSQLGLSPAAHYAIRLDRR